MQTHNIFPESQTNPPTTQYMTHLIEKLGIRSGEVTHIMNLGSGYARESSELETLFPQAKIDAIERDHLSHRIALENTVDCTRTTCVHGDADDPSFWTKLPDIDIALLQQPQIGGTFGKTNIGNWLKFSHEKIRSGGHIIICIKCESEVELFFSEYGDLLKKYFEIAFSGKNPYGICDDYYYLIALKPTGKKIPFILGQIKLRGKLLGVLN